MSTGPFFNTAKERDAWHARNPDTNKVFRARYGLVERSQDKRRRLELERLIAEARWKEGIDAKEEARAHTAKERR